MINWGILVANCKRTTSVATFRWRIWQSGAVETKQRLALKASEKGRRDSGRMTYSTRAAIFNCY
eukprot:1033966-Amphidinium_carterae.1